MNWRDFFYFSQGERIALLILLCLITTAEIILFSTDRKVLSARKNAISVSDTIQRQFKKESMVKDYRKIDNDFPDRSIYKRIERLHSLYYPYKRQEKFAKGTVLELNSADTITLKKVPGIGSYFAKKIIRFRDLLHGYASVNQLREIYGMDEERFLSLVPWFRADTNLIKKWPVNSLPADSLRKHPYLNYNQVRILLNLRRRKQKIEGWNSLKLLEEFTEADSLRLAPYLSFE